MTTRLTFSTTLRIDIGNGAEREWRAEVTGEYWGGSVVSGEPAEFEVERVRVQVGIPGAKAPHVFGWRDFPDWLIIESQRDWLADMGIEAARGSEDYAREIARAPLIDVV